MSYTAAILTISDRASEGLYEDKSGPVLKDLLSDYGLEVIDYKIIADDYDKIKRELVGFADKKISLVITTGGTGFSPRDITPEATEAIIDRRVPGIAEAMRVESAKITPMAYLSRATAGMRGNTLIINFPGSPKACKENFEIISPFLKHGLDTINGRDIH